MSLSLAFAMLCIWCCVHDFAKDLRGISKALQARVIDSKRVYQNLMFFFVCLFKCRLFGPIRYKSVWCCVHDFAKDLRGISKALQARVIDSRRVYQNIEIALVVCLFI